MGMQYAPFPSLGAKWFFDSHSEYQWASIAAGENVLSMMFYYLIASGDYVFTQASSCFCKG
jgi:hypothetical protein